MPITKHNVNLANYPPVDMMHPIDLSYVKMLHPKVSQSNKVKLV